MAKAVSDVQVCFVFSGWWMRVLRLRWQKWQKLDSVGGSNEHGFGEESANYVRVRDRDAEEINFFLERRLKESPTLN